MTPNSGARPPPGERLLFLADVVKAQAALLATTDSRLFALPMTTERVTNLRSDIGAIVSAPGQDAPRRQRALPRGPRRHIRRV